MTHPSAKNTVRSRRINWDEVRGLLRGPGRLFAVLDAKGQPLVPQLVAQIAERATSLYVGEAEHKYWHSAPYLVRLDEKLLDWVHDNLFGKPFGIFLHTAASMKDVRRHLAQFLTADTPPSDPTSFRFYDPRILPDFLRTSDEETAREFFGPVSTYIVGQSDKELDGYELPSGPSEPMPSGQNEA